MIDANENIDRTYQGHKELVLLSTIASPFEQATILLQSSIQYHQ